MKKILETNRKNVLCVAAAIVMILMACMPPAANAAAGPLRITVNQVFTASGGAGVFTYRLKPLGTGNPMPAGSTAEGYTFTIAGTSSVTIEPGTFVLQGVYRYELFQVIGASKPGYTYDKRVYTIEVHVDEEPDVIVIVYNEDRTKAETITFQNSYSGGGTTTPPTNPPPTTPPTNPPPTTPPTNPPPTDPPTTTEIPPTDPPTTEIPPTGPPLTELPPTDGSGGGNGGGSMPKTGYDSNNVFYFILIMSGAVIVLCVTICLIAREKRDRRRSQI